jgi:TDG/mug DNA glycosylase family protein
VERVAVQIRGMLPDLLAPGLRLLICGSAASERSAEVGHYYAGPGNGFWKTLAEVGLTPRELAPAEYPELLQYGIGLTDLVKDQKGADMGIDFAGDGAMVLRRKIRQFEPTWLAFNGKRTAQEFFGLKNVEYGTHSKIGTTTGVFVLPSTSAAARGAWNAEYWRQIAKLVGK